MRIHELLQLPAPVLEMTDDELEAHLRDYFPFTRPADLDQGEIAAPTSAPAPGSFEELIQAAMAAEQPKLLIRR